MYASIRGAGHFVRHLLEMCAAMCIGVAVLDLPFLGAARFVGYTDPIHQLPELTALVVAFNMTLPMAAWMRYRGMAWRPIAQMSGAMFVEAIVLIVVSWFGVIHKSGLVALQHQLMMPAMIAVMLCSLDLYTGRAGHPVHASETARSKAVPGRETLVRQ